MIRRIGLFVCALTALVVSGVSAQQVVTGTIVRIDQPAGVIVLDNGQMYQATSETVVLVNTQPTAMTAVAPGTPVVLHSAQPVVLRDGRYVLLTQPASTQHEVSGVVRWVGSSEPGRSSLTLEGGRHIWIDETTQVLSNGSPMAMSTLRPGTFVTVRSAKPLAFRDSGRGAAVAPAVAAPIVMYPNATATDSPSALPGERSRASVAVSPGSSATPVVIYPSNEAMVPSAMPAAIHSEIGLRERENERQAP